MDQSQHSLADHGGEGAAYEFAQGLDLWEKECESLEVAVPCAELIPGQFRRGLLRSPCWTDPDAAPPAVFTVGETSAKQMKTWFDTKAKKR